MQMQHMRAVSHPVTMRTAAESILEVLHMMGPMAGGALQKLMLPGRPGKACISLSLDSHTFASCVDGCDGNC